MPTLRRRNSDPPSTGAGPPALFAGRCRLGGRGPGRLGRGGLLPRRRRRRQVAVRADLLGGRALADLADPGRDRALEPAGPRRRPRRDPASRRCRYRRRDRRLQPFTAAGGGSDRRLVRPAGDPVGPPVTPPIRSRGRDPAGPVLQRRRPRLRHRDRRRSPESRSRGRTPLPPTRRPEPRPPPAREPRRARRPARATAARRSPGPAAIEVAREFAGAFVLYETGRNSRRGAGPCSTRPRPRTSPRHCSSGRPGFRPT